MSDIVERLINWECGLANEEAAMVREAAAEIERLRDANEGYQVLVRSLTAEIDRLRSALDKIYRITLAVNALKREPAA